MSTSHPTSPTSPTIVDIKPETNISPQPNSSQKTRQRVTTSEIVSFVKGVQVTPKLVILSTLSLAIVVSGAILFLVLVGAAETSDDKLWIEVTSQILNAIFTAMALYNHPFRILLLWRLINIMKSPAQQSMTATRIQREFSYLDLTVEGGKLFSDDANPANANRHGKQKPQKWSDNVREELRILLYIVILLNLNCIFQYPITICMWGWVGDRQEYRPNTVIYTFIPLSFLAGTWGSLWLMKRKRRMMGTMGEPLGRPASVARVGCSDDIKVIDVMDEPDAHEKKSDHLQDSKVSKEAAQPSSTSTSTSKSSPDTKQTSKAGSFLRRLSSVGSGTSKEDKDFSKIDEIQS